MHQIMETTEQFAVRHLEGNRITFVKRILYSDGSVHETVQEREFPDRQKLQNAVELWLHTKE